jgi:hypothetical protein
MYVLYILNYQAHLVLLPLYCHEDFPVISHCYSSSHPQIWLGKQQSELVDPKLPPLSKGGQFGAGCRKAAVPAQQDESARIVDFPLTKLNG